MPVGRPTRANKRITVSVRFEPWEITALDKARGDQTRQEWIHAKAVACAEPVNYRKPEKPIIQKPETGNISFGPRKAAPGSMLKKR